MLASNLLIFGAGASLGSENTNMPPLGNELYDQLAQINSAGWGSISEDLADLFRNDFEEF